MALLQICGGHWFVLQTAAWVGMVVSYAQESSLPQAVEKTFDGDHPCSLCKIIKEGQSEEKKGQTVKLLIKFDAVLVARVAPPAPRSADSVQHVVERPAPARAASPLSPPPRAA